MFNYIASRISRDWKLISTLALTFMTRGLMTLGAMSLNLILARELGADGIGLFMLGLSIIIGLSVVGRFGVDSALIRFGGIAHGHGNTSRIMGLKRQSRLIGGGASMLLAVLLAIFAEPVSRVIFHNEDLKLVLRVMALILPLYSLIYIQSAWFKALRKPMISPFFETGGISMMSAFLIWVMFMSGLERTVAGAALCMAAACALVLGVGAWFQKRFFSEMRYVNTSGQYDPEPGLLLQLPDYVINNLISFIIQWSSVIFLGIYATSQEVGTFSIAQRLSMMINFVLLVFNSVNSAAFASLYNGRQMKELDRLMRRSAVYSFALAFPLLTIILLFPEALLSFFGNGFQGAAMVLIILSVAQFINVISGSLSALLNMTGHQKSLRNISMISGVSSVLMNVMLIPCWGAIGAAVSSGLSLVMFSLLAGFVVHSKLGIRVIPVPWRRFPSSCRS